MKVKYTVKCTTEGRGEGVSPLWPASLLAVAG